MICRIYDVPGGTREQYDHVDERMGPATPEGAHVHVAGITDDGIKVIEVWDSEEHVNRYMEQDGLGQALEEAGLPEPAITQFEIHKLDWIG
jgi:hypothetical protein